MNDIALSAYERRAKLMRLLDHMLKNQRPFKATALLRCDVSPGALRKGIEGQVNV